MTDLAPQLTQPAAQIKQAIIGHLNNLIANQIIGSFVAVDLQKDPSKVAKNVVDWPVVLIGMDESSKNEMITNRANQRTYKFMLLVMQRFDKLNESNEQTGMEDLKDAIINEFDDDPTFGMTQTWIEPITASQTATTPDDVYNMFVLTIGVNTIIDLNFAS